MSAILVAIWSVVGAGLAWIAKWCAVNLWNSAVQLSIATAVVFAWGVFLGVVTTGIGGLGLFDIISTNPLTGLPHDMYCLFCAVFPFGFFVRLVVGYILWSLTMQQAAVVMSRVIKFIGGG